jgi:hypothetical protein
MALVLSQLLTERGTPLFITADNGSEFVIKQWMHGRTNAVYN